MRDSKDSSCFGKRFSIPEIKVPDIAASSISRNIMPSSNVADIVVPADITISKIPADDLVDSSTNTDQEVIRSMVSPSVMHRATNMRIDYPLTASKLTNKVQSSIMDPNVQAFPSIPGNDSMIDNANYRKGIADKYWSSPLTVGTNIGPQISDTQEKRNAVLDVNTANLAVRFFKMKYARTRKHKQ